MVKFRLPLSKVLKGRIDLLNGLRRRRRVPPYLLMNLRGELNEIPSPRMRVPFARLILPPEPPSVASLRRQFEQLALDPRIAGVVLRIECTASAATFQSLRKMLLDFRAQGKRLIAYANSYGPFQYFVACACDQIIMPPSAEWSVLGLLREYIFFKDAFDQLGVGVDVVNVSPFKSAFDQFARSDFSAQSREQAEWLLNAQYDELVRGIAEGRKLNEARVRELIDAAPLGTREAVAHGLLDAALYEDELEAYLAPASPPEVPKPTGKAKTAKPQPRLGLYEDEHGALLIPWHERGQKLIGIVMVEGTIVEGRSQTLPLPLPLPFFGNRFAGSESVIQALRHAADDERIAAVILYVDSGGGGALASDLIAREVRRVLARKPVVAYMSGVAASGGYYVAALARAIIAQPLTVTGSIGVISMKPNVQDAESKLRLHTTLLKRGGHSAIFSPSTPLSADEHAALSSSIQRIYDDFKRIVAEGRRMTVADMEPICGGRVWTGAMARERGLVDELGDFTAAVDKARDLAGLPAGVRPRAIAISPPRKYSLPMPQAAAEGLERMQALIGWLARPRAWTILPWRLGGRD
ncbi:MAG: signal peptide peptidase SppA [Chloroflexi bacterium]|nr:signal peptide peptidase SppA [Chloroflexota bacterium]MCL5275956.1 signal peptide peptidase SppA [Chloroflexota bacterium]